MMWTLLPLSLLCLLDVTLADPASTPFQDCFNESDNFGQKFNVSTVYAQVLQNADMGNYLNLTVFGTSPLPILGLVNTSLATLFTSTSVLTLDIWSNSSYLCQNLRPPSPLPSVNSTDGTYCPVAAGPFAFSSTIPLGNNRELTTLITQLHAVDPSGNDLVCLNIFTTPLDPQPHSLYGKANIIFWSTIALTVVYWVVIGIARIASAWGRGITRPGRGIWSRAQSAGFILASAVSGERLATSPALMHFCTPSMRDVIFHTQWCALLATVAVEWPQFVYPLLTQTAWSTLLFNISLTASKDPHWNPLATPPFSPPSDFSDQVVDPTSPLFIEPGVPNVIYNLPSNATNGISSFAYTLGIRPQDLFPTCVILFLGIIAGTIVISFFVSLLDYLVCLLGDVISGGQGQHPTMSRLAISRSPIYEATKELSDNHSTGPTEEENKALQGSSPATGKFSTARFGLPLSSASVGSERGINSHRPWWRIHSDSFHLSVLHGNLVRILVLFHLPVTVFSCYQMSLPRSLIGTSSVVLAALSFVIFSILIPAHLVIRVTFTTTSKLYDETRTLLSLGPLYNHYRHGSQLFASLFFATNIVFGVTIGVGQKSGTAQAVIILVVEVVSALVTSIWLPWGSGASMGLISFLFCVARIVIAVLLLILTPAISIGPGPGGWVAYGILIILALVYLALLFMLLGKIIEGFVRMFGGIGFDRSKHVVDTGILGACGLLGCCRSKKKRHSRSSKHKSRPRNSDLSPFLPSVGGVNNNAGTVTPRMGPGNSQPPSVLKPEHANRPYREEHNDDDGYIMGAWRPSPRASTGYIPVGDGPQTAVQGNFVLQPPQRPKVSSSSAGSTTTPGFSRIGGGRAHIDSPYAIATGSTHTFPSIGHQSQKQPSLNQSSSALAGQLLHYERSMEDNENDPPLSLSNVESGMALGNDGLPLGATQESHIRTKSQSAIIENYLPIASGSGSGPSLAKQYQQSFKAPVRHLSQDNFLRPPEENFPKNKFTFGGGPDQDDDDSGDEQDQQKKKKPWYHLRRPRLHSTEGRTSTSASATDLGGREVADGEMGGLDPSEPKQQRSFVVIRKPASSMGRLNQPSSSASATFPMDASRPPTR